MADREKQAETNAVPALSDEEILAMVERGELPVHHLKEQKFEDTFNEENLKRYMLGELTWAQLNGLSMEEAYSIAEQAYTMFEEGKRNEARSIIEAMVLANPEDGYFHALLASFYQRMEMPEEALEEYRAALDITPDNIECLVNMGEILLQRGDFERAMNMLQKAVAMDPNAENPSAMRARALARASASVFEQILKDNA